MQHWRNLQSDTPGFMQPLRPWWKTTPTPVAIPPKGKIYPVNYTPRNWTPHVPWYKNPNFYARNYNKGFTPKPKFKQTGFKKPLTYQWWHQDYYANWQRNRLNAIDARNELAHLKAQAAKMKRLKRVASIKEAQRRKDAYNLFRTEHKYTLPYADLKPKLWARDINRYSGEQRVAKSASRKKAFRNPYRDDVYIEDSSFLLRKKK